MSILFTVSVWYTLDTNKYNFNTKWRVGVVTCSSFPKLCAFHHKPYIDFTITSQLLTYTHFTKPSNSFSLELATSCAEILNYLESPRMKWKMRGIYWTHRIEDEFRALSTNCLCLKTVSVPMRCVNILVLRYNCKYSYKFVCDYILRSCPVKWLLFYFKL